MRSVTSFQADATNLLSQLVSAATSGPPRSVTSNEPLGRWGEVFSDATRHRRTRTDCVHHAEVIDLERDGHGPKDGDLG